MIRELHPCSVTTFSLSPVAMTAAERNLFRGLCGLPLFTYDEGPRLLLSFTDDANCVLFRFLYRTELGCITSRVRHIAQQPFYKA